MEIHISGTGPNTTISISEIKYASEETETELNTADWREGYTSATQDAREGTRYGDTEIDKIREEMFHQGWNSAVKESMSWFINGRLPEFYNTQDPTVHFENIEQKVFFDAADAQEAEDRILSDRGDDPHLRPAPCCEEIFSHTHPSTHPSFEPNETSVEAVIGEARKPHPAFERKQYEKIDQMVVEVPVPVPVAADAVRKAKDSGEPEKESQNLTNVAVDGMRHIPEDEYQSILDETYSRGERDAERRIDARDQQEGRR